MTPLGKEMLLASDTAQANNSPPTLSEKISYLIQDEIVNKNYERIF